MSSDSCVYIVKGKLRTILHTYKSNSLINLRDSTKKSTPPQFEMSATPIRVVVISATGKTGKSVVNGLVASSTPFVRVALDLGSLLQD